MCKPAKILFLTVLLAAVPCVAQQTPIQTGHTVYPLQARAAGIEGQVTVKAVIAKDGTVHDVHAISGPPALLQAGVDAVNQWRYKPYTQFGKPVEVNTTVTVNFNLGSKKQKAEAIAKAQAELAQQSQTSAPSPTPAASPQK